MDSARRCSSLSSTNRTSGEEAPTEYTEHTEPLAEKEVSTDDTDVHRCRRVWHPCHTHADKFCGFCEFRGNKAHPKHLCRSVKSVGEKIFPQNARNSQNLLLRKDSHRWHRCRRVWHPCHTHAAKFCEFCEFCGRKAHPKYLCKSVKSVGGKRFPQNARNAQKLLAEKSLPQMAQMSTDVGGYGIPAIPTLPNSVYSVNSVGEQRPQTICVHPCHPWESFLCKKVLCVPCIPWEE